MAITETWLKDHISDAQIEITDYTSHRADRKQRRGGGCVIYLHNAVIATHHYSYSDKYNSMVLIYCESLHTIMAAVYRPPDSPDSTFRKTMDELQLQVDELSSRERTPDIYIMGDFNLPLFDWGDCTPPASTPNGAYLRTKEFIDHNFLTQIVTKPTRGNNVLDLILTNRPQDVATFATEPTKISDHKLVECTLVFNPIENDFQYTPNWDCLSFRAVNIHKADFDSIRSDMQSVDWLALRDLCEKEGDEDGGKFKELLTQTVLQISLKHSPKKEVNAPQKKGKLNKELESLKRRRRKLNSKIRHLEQTNPLSTNIPKYRREVSLTTYGMRDVIEKRLQKSEEVAVQTIKSNPKYFFSYAKRFSKSRSCIAPLKRPDGSLATDAKEKADILQRQYVSVFSRPEDADLDKCLSWVEDKPRSGLEDFTFSPKDIEDAICELDPYSAAPDDDIPAKILCACKSQLAYPIWLIWEKSFRTGIIPPDFKKQYITPIFKKGNKTEAANYRPVSITSHLIKTFERVMRNKLVDYLESNNILPNNQHGFRKGRSCLTQLLEHVDTILKHLNSGQDVDVIYLDYSKAFDKVDHRVLLAKLRKYGIRGKVFQWIENFLTDRLQTVTVQGKKSSFESVVSSVPQGTVLGPIFFIVYVIDQALMLLESKSLTFADDTKLLKAIMSMLCCALLQEDLDRVVEWSIANNMQLHEDKFEVISYCLNTTRNNPLRNLPFSTGLGEYLTPSGAEITPSDTVRDLGVHLSNDCSWTHHVSIIAAEAGKMAAWVLGTFRELEEALDADA